MKLKKISEVEWEIPRTGEMKVPGKIFASEKLLKEIQKDDSLIQVKKFIVKPMGCAAEQGR